MILLKHVKKSYHQKVIFEDLNLEFHLGKLTVLLGPSGVGKSTILKMISKQEVYEGLIEYPESLLNCHIPFPIVFQDDQQLLPWLTVKDNICLPVEHSDLQEIVRSVGIEDTLSMYPSELSGGMRQRVAIARALMCHSELLIMDEPFNALDINRRLKLQEMIKSIKKTYGKTILFVTHDIEEALAIADDIYIIKKDQVVKVPVSGASKKLIMDLMD